MTGDIITATLPQQDKQYDFRQLQDLQSRLMLVAGRNQLTAKETGVSVEMYSLLSKQRPALDTLDNAEQTEDSDKKIKSYNQRSTFVKELVDIGYDKTLAEMALDHVHEEDISSCDLSEVAETESVERMYASNYKVGEPNLIVCPAGEILKVTLSIYMHDKKQPLPLSDEVLVCHTDTTIDETVHQDAVKKYVEDKLVVPVNRIHTVSCVDFKRRCGVINPSWSELQNFAWFLNTQLVDYENNQFVSNAASEDLPGFATFVLRFLMQMSKDFATRSLHISEESPFTSFSNDADETMVDEDILNRLALRRTWESRDQKILKLCNVMGIDVPHDPDSTYELTTDNVKKIFAIYMKFRSGIPVVIMGETGCGKTRLVKFMCALQCPPGVNVNNMILMKVHGGTIKEDIKRSIKKAEEQARQNVRMMAEYKTNIYTVLFFDEANTTEAIGLIKEVMCDKSICGEPLKFYENLKIVAACNPYRKHPDELIHKLEQAGLGYHVDADETTDKLGRVPMRRL
ncbi:hypothetical protein DPMN_054302, partial [Dreissena polymorpha]